MDIFLKKIGLDHFCGFKTFVVDVEPFTVFIGPNNGGKTTLLRAVRFVLTAFRQAVADESGNLIPGKLQALGNQRGTASAIGPAAIPGVSLVHFMKDRGRDAAATLHMLVGDDDVTLGVKCLGAQESYVIHLHVNESPFSQFYESDQNAAHEIARRLCSLSTEFVPPVGAISPSENELPWRDLQNQLASGRYSETWRNQLHWLSEHSEGPRTFLRVMDRVRGYLPDIEVQQPRRSKQASLVELMYREGNTEYDIAAGGGDMRTLITLASLLELSSASVLLFDEPDAHLHSAIQRQVSLMLQDAVDEDRHILVSSHAPDFIEEVPVESLRWIDRTMAEARVCDSLGLALLDLGAVSRVSAIREKDANVLLCVEGALDRRILEDLLRKVGLGHIADRARIEPLEGFGDAKHLPGVHAVLTKVQRLPLSIVAIRDADYTAPIPTGKAEQRGGVLFLRWPCKELENLILLSPETVIRAVEQINEVRQQSDDLALPVPTLQEIKMEIDRLSEVDGIRKIVETQWLCAYAEKTGTDLNKPGGLAEARRRYEKLWADPEWRRRCCPGKRILRQLCGWLHEKCGTRIAPSRLLSAYEPTEEVSKLLEKLRQFVDGTPDKTSAD